MLCFWGSNLKRLQSGVVGYPLCVFVLTNFPISLFYCSRVSSTALATGRFWKMWFVSFSRSKESHWLICHLLCLGNQSLESLQNNIPKGHFSSQPQLLFLFILVLFSWLLLLWFVIISNPLGWITRPKKGHRPLRGTRVRVSQVSTRAERMQTHHSLFPVPWICQSWVLEEDECKCSELSLCPWIIHGQLDILGSFGRVLLAFSGSGQASTASPGHWSTILLHRLLHQRREPSPNSFKPVA